VSPLRKVRAKAGGPIAPVSSIALRESEARISWAGKEPPLPPATALKMPKKAREFEPENKLLQVAC